MLLDANTTSNNGFLPVDLSLVSEGVVFTSRPRTVSLMTVPTSRSKFRSNALINFAKLLSWFPGTKAGPDLPQDIHVVGMNELRQQVTDHGSMKGKLDWGSRCNA